MLSLFAMTGRAVVTEWSVVVAPAGIKKAGRRPPFFRVMIDFRTICRERDLPREI